MASLQQILSWFKSGLFPNEDQFRQTWLSFWHKSEKIPQTQVFGLENSLNNVSVGMIYKLPVQNISDLETTYPNAKAGWSVKVESNGNIYQYDGSTWNNTGLTAFPSDVVTSPELNEARTEIKLNLHNAFNPDNIRKGYSINVAPPHEILSYPGSIITGYIKVPPGATKIYYSGFGLYPRFRFSPQMNDTGEASAVSPSLPYGTIGLNTANPEGFPYLTAQVYRGEDYQRADLSKVKISFDSYEDMVSLKKVADNMGIISGITFVNLFDKEKLRRGFAIDVNPPHSVIALTSMVFLLTDFIEIPPGATLLKYSGLATFGNYIRCRLSKTPEDVSQSVTFEIKGESGTIDLTGYAPAYKYFCAMVYRANTMPTDKELNDIALCFNFGNIGDEINGLKKRVDTIWDTMPEVSSPISTLVVDLPVSDGSDIQTGYAYIETSTGNIKVKL